MSKITEEDVFNCYMPLIWQECKNSYKGLEWEDRIAEGAKALIYVIRTYKTRYGDFKEYMLTQLRKIMKQKNAEAWAVKKLDSPISLNAPIITGKDDFTLAECTATMASDDSVLYVKWFIDSLSQKEQNIVLLRMGNHSIHDISNMLGVSVHEVQSTLNGLKRKITVYNGDDLCVD